MTTLQLGTLAALVYRFGEIAVSAPKLVRWLLLAIYELMAGFSRALTGIHINPRIAIGPGFIIHNFAAINIDAAAIGENFTVNQGVSVGYDWRGLGRPTIGSNVFLGAGAKALGAISLGDNVVVAANALVVSSVPDNCTVAGVPARIIARDSGSSYLQLKSPEKQPAPAAAG
jgi:serine O-acetyltransferase